jgi:hypothetical protein
VSNTPKNMSSKYLEAQYTARNFTTYTAYLVFRMINSRKVQQVLNGKIKDNIQMDLGKAL